MEIVNVKISELKFAEYNPREITEHDYEALKNAIREFGIVDPIIVNKKGNEIIGGHMRVRAAQELGIEEVPVVYVNLPDEKAKLLNLALNRIQGRWDREKLEKLLYELSQKEVDLELSGFEPWELDFYNPGPTNEEFEKELEELKGYTPAPPLTITLIFREANLYFEFLKRVSNGKPRSNIISVIFRDMNEYEEFKDLVLVEQDI